MTTSTTQEGGGAPWWRERAPRTDEERMQLASLSFVAQPHLELAIAVRDQLPELWSRYTVDKRQEVEHYARQRLAKVQLGGWSPPPVDEAAIEALRTAFVAYKVGRRGDQAAVDRRYRQQFRSAFASGGDCIAVLSQWCLALHEERRIESVQGAVEGQLGIGSGGLNPITAPVFADEIRLAAADLVRDGLRPDAA